MRAHEEGDSAYPREGGTMLPAWWWPFLERFQHSKAKDVNWYLFKNIFLKSLICLFVCAHMCAYGCVHTGHVGVHVGTCRCQRTVLGSWFSPPATWVLGIKLRLSGLEDGDLTH